MCRKQQLELLESVNDERGKFWGCGSFSSFSQPRTPPPPHPKQDEQTRLCRRKLTVISFDPQPCKERAKNNRAVAQAFWSGQEGPGRDFHHQILQGWGLFPLCMTWASVIDKWAAVTLSKQKHASFQRWHGSCNIWSHLHVRGAAPEVLRLRPPDTSASLLLGLWGSHHYKVHTHLASLQQHTHTQHKLHKLQFARM